MNKTLDFFYKHASIRMENIFKELKKVIVHLIKERILLFTYYDVSLKRKTSKQLLVSIFDDRRNSFGLTDRFKGIVSLYAYSKIKNIDYRCYFTYPFELSKFLVPNKYNWSLKDNELSTNLVGVKVLILHGEKGKRLISLRSEKQVHAYINRDYIPLLNKLCGTNFLWGDLFNELFRPSPELEDCINYSLDKTGKDYIGCVFRFQSLLGDFKEYNFAILNKNENQKLINKCIDALLKLQKELIKPILVTSDSTTFLSEISSIEGIVTIPGKVVHLDCTDTESDDVYMKSFVDFIMLSKAEKIYSIGTDQMYPTEFPLYAAKINNIPFERILI